MLFAQSVAGSTLMMTVYGYAVMAVTVGTTSDAQAYVANATFRTLTFVKTVCNRLSHIWDHVS